MVFFLSAVCYVSSHYYSKLRNACTQYLLCMPLFLTYILTCLSSHLVEKTVKTYAGKKVGIINTIYLQQCCSSVYFYIPICSTSTLQVIQGPTTDTKTILGSIGDSRTIKTESHTFIYYWVLYTARSRFICIRHKDRQVCHFR